MTPRVVITLGIEAAPRLDVECASQSERDRLADWITQDTGRSALVTIAAAVVGCLQHNPDDDEEAGE